MCPFLLMASTDKAVREQETVMIRYINNGRPVTSLVQIVELENAHAMGTFEVITKDQSNQINQSKLRTFGRLFQTWTKAYQL